MYPEATTVEAATKAASVKGSARKKSDNTGVAIDWFQSNGKDACVLA